MGIALSIGILLVVVVLGALGWRRGLYRGLLTLAGTLLGAVIVDVWLRPWSATLGSDVWTWTLATIVFLAVVGVVGYGGSVLLPRATVAAKPNLRERALGVALGALNGLLIWSYVLHFGAELRPDTGLMQVVQASYAAQLLRAWLPWFTLTLVLLTWIFVLVRLLLPFVKARTQARQSAVQPGSSAEAVPPATPAASPPPAESSASSAPASDKPSAYPWEPADQAEDKAEDKPQAPPADSSTSTQKST